MTLLPDEIVERVPRIGSDPETPLFRTLIHARLYDPLSSWEWLVIEFDGRDTFFGLIVNRDTVVAGQFSGAELAAVDAGEEKGPGIRCDAGFIPVTVGALARSRPAVAEFLKKPIPREIHASGDLVDLEDL